MNGDEQVVAEFAKNSREVVRVYLHEYEGHDLVGVRVFYRAEGGELRPGKAGLNLRVALLPALLAAIERAAEMSKA